MLSKIRVSAELPAAIKFAFSLITKEDCHGCAMAF